MLGKNKERCERKNKSRDNSANISGIFENMNHNHIAHRSYFIGTITGIVLGALLCAGGFVLTILGLSGSVNWIIKLNGISSRLTNASPGVFFAILGMILVLKLRPKVTDEMKIGPYGRKLKLESRGTAKSISSSSSADEIKKEPTAETQSLSSDHTRTENK